MKLTEADKAGLWALAFLGIAGLGAWFTIIAIVWYHIKRWFL
jgi:hypothetical protein